MTHYKRIGLDTSKAVFTVHGIDAQEQPILRLNLRRAQMVPFFRKLAPAIIALGLAAVPTTGRVSSQRLAIWCVWFHRGMSNPTSNEAGMIATTRQPSARRLGVRGCISCQSNPSTSKRKAWF